MRNHWVKRARPVLVALLAAAPLLGCGGGGEEGGRQFALAGEEQEIQGTVVGTELTLCGPTPDKPGTCEGHLLVEREGATGAEPVQIEVTRDVVLEKGGQPVFLPQLNGSVVRATYRTAETGEKVATSVTAEGTESE
jgi:hypothetical protein